MDLKVEAYKAGFEFARAEFDHELELGEPSNTSNMTSNMTYVRTQAQNWVNIFVDDPRSEYGEGLKDAWLAGHSALVTAYDNAAFAYADKEDTAPKPDRADKIDEDIQRLNERLSKLEAREGGFDYNRIREIEKHGNIARAVLPVLHHKIEEFMEKTQRQIEEINKQISELRGK